MGRETLREQKGDGRSGLRRRHKSSVSPIVSYQTNRIQSHLVSPLELRSLSLTVTPACHAAESS